MNMRMRRNTTRHTMSVLQRMLLLVGLVVDVVDASYDCNALLDAQGARRLLPSTVANRTVPNIYVPSRNITLPGDVAHVVIPPSSSSSSSDYLKVFLPATLSSPAPFSCLLASLGGPVVGLMYEWLHDADANRAGQCAVKYNSTQSLQYSNCLASGTEDALRGGRREGIWQDVHPLDSIQGRLTLLLEYLVLNYPSEGWDRFLVEAPGTRVPAWPDIWLLGHSQGAGHAAYMAQAYELRGAGILGGPQQLCDLAACWTARPWKTQSVRVLVHRDEEYYDVAVRNLQNTPSDGPFAAFAEPFDISNVTDSTRLPQNVPWVTSIPMFPTASCGAVVGPHCSVAVDRNAPLLANADLSDNKTVNPVMYAAHVWPQLAGRGDTVAPTVAPTAAPTPDEEEAPPTGSSSSSSNSAWRNGMWLTTMTTTTTILVGEFVVW